MGHTLIFDTHAYVKRLVTAGVSEQQAEIQAETLSELIDNNLATKRDLKELEMRLTIRLGAIMAGGIVLVATIVKIL